MSLHRRHVRSVLHTITVPLLTAAVVAGSPSFTVSVPASAAITEPVELTASIDTSSTTVGMADSSLYFMDQADLDTAMQHLQSMGVTQIRVFLPWRAMEPADGTYDWTQADQLLDTAASYGIAVDAAITSSPTWASPYGGLVADGAPRAASDYASFVAAVASRYGSAANNGDAKIASYEIWNEPNGFTGWYPTPDAAAYTALLKAAYTAIKAVDPKATVVGGVLGAGNSIGTLTINPVTFLTEMYADGAAGYFDALAFHPYNYTSLFSAGSTFVNSALQQLEQMRAVMEANGDAAKLIWATEYGEPSTQAGEANQAAYIQDFLTTWATLSGVGPSFIYSLIDTATGSSTAEDNLGVFTDTWTAKQAVAVIEAWIAAHPISTGPSTATVPPVLSQLVTAVTRMMQAVVTGITTMVSRAITTVRQLAAAVVSAVRNALASLPAARKATAHSVKASAVPATATVAAVTPKRVGTPSAAKAVARQDTSTGASTTRHVTDQHAGVGRHWRPAAGRHRQAA
ncbi:cellulase family glycosylhydrolase [Mycolicibacterium sp. 120266]|uniref:cellulase family glycosylhydrolase n=1 Tax=Mycolicibacterium sp. 120266 TaxID=3090601 RepID=UPI00299F2123|nr:cellulase family glycosylhydrolase [Mycolicibacterium sp. 120266]MDX1872661.1 cellulase family glycosylhydrolase [Mycolicibacterium sp. 120266]